jgi:hypothetical protein
MRFPAVDGPIARICARTGPFRPVEALKLLPLPHLECHYLHFVVVGDCNVGRMNAPELIIF